MQVRHADRARAPGLGRHARELRDAFARFDANGDGYLSVEELVGVFTRPVDDGEPMTEEQARAYVAKHDKNGDGRLDLDEFARLAQHEGAWGAARAEVNRYTTTLHAINSAIVKLSKLTYACEVYRGINNRVLPPEFWQANEYGVRGGIEAAFMSTTRDRDVALSYAQGDGQSAKAGFVFEIQQGMVDRGADLSFLSQYPHEREILFAPLAGFEVKFTRVEGEVLVVVVSLAVNLTAQTIEQVISKRRKLMVDST